MKIELTDKEVKKIGENRYLRPMNKRLTIWTSILAVLSLTMIGVGDKVDGLNYVMWLGLGLYSGLAAWLIYIFMFKAEKAGSEFLNKMKLEGDK